MGGGTDYRSQDLVPGLAAAGHRPPGRRKPESSLELNSFLACSGLDRCLWLAERPAICGQGPPPPSMLAQASPLVSPLPTYAERGPAPLPVKTTRAVMHLQRFCGTWAGQATNRLDVSLCPGVQGLPGQLGRGWPTLRAITHMTKGVTLTCNSMVPPSMPGAPQRSNCSCLLLRLFAPILWHFHEK